MVWPTVPEFGDDEAALDILGAILSSGKTSRLTKSLVREKQIAQSVAAGQTSQEISGVFMIDATAQPGHKLAELETAILEQVARIQDQPPTAEELARALNRIETQVIRSMESHSGFGGLADQLNKYNVTKGDPGYLSKDFERYQRSRPRTCSAWRRNTWAPAGSCWRSPGTEVKITPDPRVPAEEAREKLAKGEKATPMPFPHERAREAAEEPYRLTLAATRPRAEIRLAAVQAGETLQRHRIDRCREARVAHRAIEPGVSHRANIRFRFTARGLAALTAAVWDEGTKNSHCRATFRRTGRHRGRGRVRRRLGHHVGATVQPEAALAQGARNLRRHADQPDISREGIGSGKEDDARAVSASSQPTGDVGPIGGWADALRR